MTPAIDSTALVDENSKSKDMESLEPLTAKPPVVAEPPHKKSRKGEIGEFMIFRNNLRRRGSRVDGSIVTHDAPKPK